MRRLPSATGALGPWGSGGALLGALAVVAACAETRRPLGEECLTNDDCLSAVCSALRCAAAPPKLNGAPEAPPDAAVVDDAAADGANEGGSASSDGGSHE